jgi:(p)ppGpp synthase/HD superfamily hydrolase
MKHNEMLMSMLRAAVEGHDGVYDKGGQPYFFHVYHVMTRLHTDDPELKCIALGHDLIEDTDLTDADLIIMGFNDRVIDGIRALTKIPGESYDDYRNKVMGNRDAMLVKMQDLRHNMDIRRLKGTRPKDYERIERYQKFYVEIKAALAILA